jgi:hypothetical protein
MGIINRRAYRSEGREVISVKTLAYAKYWARSFSLFITNNSYVN